MIISQKIGKLLKFIAISLSLLIACCVYANAYDIQTSTTPAINGKPSGESKPVETYTDRSGLWITFHDGNDGDLIIINPQGRKVGYNPITKTKYLEIPEATYMFMTLAEGDSDGSKILDIPQPLAGNYQLQVVGIVSETYSLYISAHNDTLSTHSVTDLRNIPIEPNIVHTYNFYFPKTTADVRFFATGANFYGGVEQDIGTNTDKLLTYVYPAQETTTLPKGTETASIVVIYDITIIPATFKATLNGTDVTNLFKPTAGWIESVKLKLNPNNTNTLILSAASNLLGKTTIDTDKLIFIVP